MRSKVFTTVVLLTALLVIVGGCAPAATPTPAKATVKYAYFGPFMVVGPVFVAEEEGYFAEQGIELEWVFFQNMSQALPAVVQGQVDAAFAGSSAGLGNAVTKGMNLKLVASMAADRPQKDCLVEALMVRKELYDSGEVKSAADLKGKRVAILGRYSVTHYSVSTVLRSAGLDDDDVEWVIMSLPDTVGVMKEGKIDAAFGAEPFISIMKNIDAAVPLVGLHEWVQDSVFILFGPTLLEKDRELGKRFMVAYLKGARQFAEGKTARNVEIMAKRTKQDQELVEAQCWPDQEPNGHMDFESYDRMQKWWIERGLQDTTVTAEQVLDTSFVEHALEVLGKVEK